MVQQTDDDIPRTSLSVRSSCQFLLVHPRKVGLIFISALLLWVVQKNYSVIVSSEVMEGFIRGTTLAKKKSSTAPTSTSWFDEYVDQIARPFQPFSGTKWCQIDNQQSMELEESADITRSTQPLEGLMLTKVHKAGSTTAAGVTLSIALRFAKRQRQGDRNNYLTKSDTTKTTAVELERVPMCHSYFHHTFSIFNHHSNRNMAKSFLWTTVRLPHTRAESSFYYYQPPERYDDEKWHLEFLSLSRGHQLRLIRKRNERLEGYHGNLYLQETSYNRLKKEAVNSTISEMGIPDVSIIDTDPERLAHEHIGKEVLDYYNFVALTERWVESMAVLKILLPGVQYSDLIVLRTKEHGAYVSYDHSCKFIPDHSEVSDSIQAYLDGPYRDTNPDYLLYAAANRSLDLTIESIGRDRVEHGVRQIQYLQQLAQESCAAISSQPCDEFGKRHKTSSCYVRDFGCGHQCIEDILPPDEEDEDDNH